MLHKFNSIRLFILYIPIKKTESFEGHNPKAIHFKSRLCAGYHAWLFKFTKKTEIKWQTFSNFFALMNVFISVV